MSDYGPAWYVGERPCGLAGEIGGEERKIKATAAADSYTGRCCHGLPMQRWFSAPHEALSGDILCFEPK